MAYDALVDRLLASPHYGERWARHWLDLARFAESHGFEHDYDRPTAYHFRDFVIQALNDDLPLRHVCPLAVGRRRAGAARQPGPDGDRLSGGRRPQHADHQERSREAALRRARRHAGHHRHRHARPVGRLRRCHDHKFDPIPQADYYRLLSTFTTTVRTRSRLPLGPETGQPQRLKVLVASEGLPPVRLHTPGRRLLQADLSSSSAAT